MTYHDATGSGSTSSLAESIAAATRLPHAKLNKLIIARLPLALPPRAADPSLYASGLLHIAPIYITFESLWQNILDTPPMSFDHGKPNVDERLRMVLNQLHLPQLLRSDRLKADIQAMTGWQKHVVEEQLRTISQDGRLSEFLRHMKRSVENHPHVLLSYTYIFFMALFAGGRFIRASLESVGEDFWKQVPSPVKPTMKACETHHQESTNKNEDRLEDSHLPHACRAMPLRFFHFPTPSDGEDLKREFKKRLVEMEDVLTPQEKHDVVKEAVCIFENMTLLVHQLDNVCGGSLQEAANPGDYSHLFNLPGNILATRLRDSVAIAKERRSARNSSRESESPEEPNSSPADVHDLGASEPPDETINPLKANTFPYLPGVSGVAMCPAMTSAGNGKSMRFEKPSNHPNRIPSSFDGSAQELGGRLNLASKSVRSHIRTANLVLIAAIGVIIFGAYVSGRRGLDAL